eukprot:6213286-Pleurochrysis_carterae.AAC.3
MSSFTSLAKIPTMVTFLFAPLVLSNWTCSSRVPIGQELRATHIKECMSTVITTLGPAPSPARTT